MKLTIEPTSQLVSLEIDGREVPARLWQGFDDQGVAVDCFITRVAVHESFPAEVHERFGRELRECPKAQPARFWPLRMFLP